MSLLEMLAQQAGGGLVTNLARQLGSDEDATGRAVSAALPALVGALARNAAAPGGAESLSNALQSDHDGSVLDDLGGLLGSGSGAGDGILGHVLGNGRGAVEQSVSRSSGLDAGTIARLLPLLAPIVMGMLGKQQRQQGLDADGLAGMLSGEQARVERQAPGMLGQLLDADGDGDATDDVMRMGASLLGGLFGKR